MNFKKIIASALALTLSVSSAAALADEASFIEIDGNKFVMEQDGWNIDFTGEEVGSHRWGSPYVELKNSLTSATLVSPLGDAFTMHTGSAANIIASGDSGDPEYGDAMKFVANDDNQVQMNESAATAGGDLIAYEFDYKLSKLPEKSNATVTVFQPVMAPDSWVGSLGISPNPSMLQFSASGGVIPAETGKWYHITCYLNYISRTCSYYIDGELLSTFALPAAAQNKGKKMVIKLANAKGAECWIDNIRHYSLSALPAVKSVKTSGNTLDVEFTTAVSADNFVSGDSVVNFEASYPNGNIEIADCEQGANANTVRFVSTTAIPTSVKLELGIIYKNVEIGGTFETSPAQIDFKNITIEKNGSSFTAKATGHNESGEEHFAVMIMALYDANGAVVAMSYGLPSPVFTDIDIYASATSDKAVAAKVFFMENWDSIKPFKDVYYTFN